MTTAAEFKVPPLPEDELKDHGVPLSTMISDAIGSGMQSYAAADLHTINREKRIRYTLRVAAQIGGQVTCEEIDAHRKVAVAAALQAGWRTTTTYRPEAPMTYAVRSIGKYDSLEAVARLIETRINATRQGPAPAAGGVGPILPANARQVLQYAVQLIQVSDLLNEAKVNCVHVWMQVGFASAKMRAIDLWPSDAGLNHTWQNRPINPAVYATAFDAINVLNDNIGQIMAGTMLPVIVEAGDADAIPYIVLLLGMRNNTVGWGFAPVGGDNFTPFMDDFTYVNFDYMIIDMSTRNAAPAGAGIDVALPGLGANVAAAGQAIPANAFRMSEIKRAASIIAHSACVADHVETGLVKAWLNLFNEPYSGMSVVAGAVRGAVGGNAHLEHGDTVPCMRGSLVSSIMSLICHDKTPIDKAQARVVSMMDWLIGNEGIARLRTCLEPYIFAEQVGNSYAGLWMAVIHPQIAWADAMAPGHPAPLPGQSAHNALRMITTPGGEEIPSVRGDYVAKTCSMLYEADYPNALTYFRVGGLDGVPNYPRWNATVMGECFSSVHSAYLMPSLLKSGSAGMVGVNIQLRQLVQVSAVQMATMNRLATISKHRLKASRNEGFRGAPGCEMLGHAAFLWSLNPNYGENGWGTRSLIPQVGGNEDAKAEQKDAHGYSMVPLQTGEVVNFNFTPANAFAININMNIPGAANVRRRTFMATRLFCDYDPITAVGLGLVSPQNAASGQVLSSKSNRDRNMTYVEAYVQELPFYMTFGTGSRQLAVQQVKKRVRKD